ncbi:MAG: putative glycosyltransferase CsbB [candidate division WS6 bacterium OLB20]|uniref:Putative glycosyltransferase CsbB n=1 Tax=candidate division WS6 bacterium OLB20 TaxID=1617426 RepID=A0A136LYQ5_9BACT|nr:MAG: putative glycosyltransferase CsbB [candidate division WS6 bacterium OLB20]
MNRTTNQSDKILVSIVIPAYRAGRFILETVKSRLVELESLHVPYEIIVVIDGRSVETAEALKKLAHPNVRYYHYEKNRGKGFAVKFGMARARGAYIGYVDAGADILPGNLTRLITTMQKTHADAVIPSKWHPDTLLHYSGRRRLFSKLYNAFSRILLGIPVRDTQVGVKLYRRELVHAVIPRLLVKRFAFEVEFLSVAWSLGFKRFEEVPVTLKEDIEGSTVTLLEGIRSFWDTAAVFYRLRLLRYYRGADAGYFLQLKQELSTLRLLD